MSTIVVSPCLGKCRNQTQCMVYSSMMTVHATTLNALRVRLEDIRHRLRLEQNRVKRGKRSLPRGVVNAMKLLLAHHNEIEQLICSIEQGVHYNIDIPYEDMTDDAE